MRLDKYLKVSRLIKRRTMAKAVADQGRVKINGQKAKAGTEVKLGDELDVLFGQKHVNLRIDRIEEKAKKEDAATFYTILSEEKINND
ncbi:RNA-binding S4 domain-containing protein [Salipaludibacillus sp. HK11]|uniref:RNA-binding S4 domain-containing protein n=1 Tax=Salipaludibacillus sp. HK11 TaxID=3394320 RepID=UPI0039FCD9B3